MRRRPLLVMSSIVCKLSRGNTYKLSVSNGLLHALIYSQKLFLNSQLVESDYQANYTQYVKTITSENNDYITNQCEAMGYFPESTIINTTSATYALAAQEANVPRRKVYAAKENIQLYGPLNLYIGKC